MRGTSPSRSPRAPARRTLVRTAARLVVAVAGAAVAAACAGRYATLLADHEVPAFAAMTDAASAMPSHRERVVACTAAGDAPPLHIAVEEVGTGQCERVLVMIHGVVSDRRTWRFMAGDLGRDHDLLLLDLPGCGASDCPPPGSRGPDDYGPTALARCVLNVLRDRASRRNGPTRFTLVGHSLGGSVILRMLGDPALREEFADARARVDGAVLFAPGDFGLLTPPDALRQLATVSAVEVELGRALGIVREVIAKRYDDEAPERGIPLREEVDRTLEHLAPGRRLDATQAMLRRALPLRADGTPDWELRERMLADYGNVDVPCLIVWGERDATLEVASGYRMAARIPRARLVVVPRSTHSLPTERPSLCSDYVRRFALDCAAPAAAADVAPPSPGAPAAAPLIPEPLL